MHKIVCHVEAKKAFDDGKISKTSYWRFKARGWVCVDYHTRLVKERREIVRRFPLEEIRAAKKEIGWE